MSAPQDMKAFNAQLIEQFRASHGHGEAGPVHFDRVALLTTTGRKTGKPRTVPIGWFPNDDGNLILFASNSGAPEDPNWVRNIRSDPHVTVEITDETFESDAVILTGAARGAAYQLWMDSAPHVAGHQDQAGREIPLVLVPKPS